MQGGEGNFIKKDREMLPLIEINRVRAYYRAKWEPVEVDLSVRHPYTHVLINDPTRGYGIFIEHMLNAA
jgi:hypothetical protein